jgi:hypothetical protein
MGVFLLVTALQPKTTLGKLMKYLPAEKNLASRVPVPYCRLTKSSSIRSQNTLQDLSNLRGPIVWIDNNFESLAGKIKDPENLSGLHEAVGYLLQSF